MIHSPLPWSTIVVEDGKTVIRDEKGDIVGTINSYRDADFILSSFADRSDREVQLEEEVESLEETIVTLEEKIESLKEDAK